MATNSRRSFLKQVLSITGIALVPGSVLSLSSDEESSLAKRVVKSGLAGVLTYCERNYCSVTYCASTYSSSCPKGYCSQVYCSASYRN